MKKTVPACATAGLHAFLRSAPDAVFAFDAKLLASLNHAPKASKNSPRMIAAAISIFFRPIIIGPLIIIGGCGCIQSPPLPGAVMFLFIYINLAMGVILLFS